MAENEGKTVIAEDVEVTGSIKCAGNIQIDGKLNGDLACSGNAMIGQSAVVKGNISAGNTAVLGQINGNIATKDKTELKSSARVIGDVRSKRLVVEDGVSFVGKCEVNPSAPPARTAGADESKVASSPESEPDDKGDAKSRAGIFARR